jgi:hypothetical protein
MATLNPSDAAVTPARFTGRRGASPFPSCDRSFHVG